MTEITAIAVIVNDTITTCSFVNGLHAPYVSHDGDATCHQRAHGQGSPETVGPRSQLKTKFNAKITTPIPMRKPEILASRLGVAY